MKKLVIVSTDTNEKLIAKEKSYNTSNKPFTRHQIILNDIAVKFPNSMVAQNLASETQLKKIISDSPCVTKEYILFLENAYKSYKESMTTSEDYISPYDDGLVNYLFNKDAVFTNLENIPYYLQCGIYGNDFCTSIFDNTYLTAIKSAYNGVIAAKIIESNIIIYCLNILPGHHASKNLYSGYCFINNAAICAFELLKKYQKISILDIDYHHGDGTQKIFYENPRVLTVSIHGNPQYSYPFYTGYANEVGSGNGTKFNLNFPLEIGTNIEIYKNTLSIALDAILDFNPDILIIAFGADTHIFDPQGGFHLETDDYLSIGKLVKSKISKPIIVMQEGGYYLEVVGKIICNFLDGLFN